MPTDRVPVSLFRSLSVLAIIDDEESGNSMYGAQAMSRGQRGIFQGSRCAQLRSPSFHPPKLRSRRTAAYPDKEGALEARDIGFPRENLTRGEIGENRRVSFRERIN